MIKRLKNSVLVFAAILLGTAAAGAETFKTPNVPDHEKRVTAIHYEGKKIDPKTASLSQKLLWLGSPGRLDSEFHWEGTGPQRHSVFVMTETLNNKNTAVNTFVFKPGDKLVIQTYERVEKLPQGRRLRREFYNFGHPDNNYSEDTMHPYTLEIAFRGLEFKNASTRQEFKLWLPPGIIMPMEVRTKGEEKLETPIGARQCYKVEIAPDMSKFLGQILGRLIQPLIPKYRFWFDVNGTHPIMRYIGPLGKVNVVGVPDEVYSIVSLDPDPSK